MNLTRKAQIKKQLRGLLNPLVSLLSYFGVSPFAVTFVGIGLSFIGAFVVGRGLLPAGGLLLLASGICDILDGSLARRNGKVTSFGAFIDSSGDRITEIAYFGGLVFYFLREKPVSGVMVFFLFIALAGSFLTSYARARAEGLGLECMVGWLERPERIALIVLGLLLGRTVLSVVIVFLAFLTVYTFIQRVLHVRRLTLDSDLPSDRGSDTISP